MRGNGEVKTTYPAPDGGYGVTGLQAGRYTMSAAKTGRTFTCSGPANPVVVGPNKPRCQLRRAADASPPEKN